jgi:hypothetical protein
MTTCELEADASVADVLNRQQLVTRPLAHATPDMQLVQSLARLWDEERQRAAAAGAPRPARASSPERPKPPDDKDAQRARRALRCAPTRFGLPCSPCAHSLC